MAVSNSKDPIERQATRILFIIYFCNDVRLPALPLFPEYPFDDFTHAIDSETKLQKIEFWIRYPDHLATALILGCEQPDGPLLSQAENVKRVVRNIIGDEEPTVRWVPMRKFLYGAHERLDDVMNLLTSLDLAYRRVVEDGRRTRYFLRPKGSRAVDTLLATCPHAQWYADRCSLIDTFFGHLDGISLRRIQYLLTPYHDAAFHETIGRVTDRIPSTFLETFGESL